MRIDRAISATVRLAERPKQAGIRGRVGIPTLSTMIVVALACSLLGCSQANIKAESQMLAPSITYIGAWGARGDGPGLLDQPTGIATDVLGNVYLADAGSQYIHKFTWEGHPLLSFQESGMKHPQSITLDSGGAIYVTDPSRGSIFVFFPNGDRYRELRLRIRPNSEDTLSVAVGDDGAIHVLDADAGRVFTYTSRFRTRPTWQPTAGPPNTKVRAKGIGDGPDDSLFMADPSSNRIVRFTVDGHFASEVNGGAGGTLRKIGDQFAVSHDDIFAMDADGRTLHVWSMDGRLKLDADLGPELGQGNRLPPPLAISPRKELLVLDAPGARILRYRINF